MCIRDSYKTTSGTAGFPIPGQTSSTGPYDNATVEAVNAATGQMVWSHFIPNQGYRGGVATSGNVLFLTLSSGDLLMLNAQTGDTVKDYYIGGPLNVLPSVGATQNGVMEVIVPITVGLVTWGTAVPGDIVALTLQNVPAINVVTSTTTSVSTTTVGGGGAVTVTSTVGGGGAVTITSTSISTVAGGGAATVTVTSTAPGTSTGTGVDATTLYGVAAVAVIFIIATGYLAMNRRRPGA